MKALNPTKNLTTIIQPHDVGVPSDISNKPDKKRTTHPEFRSCGDSRRDFAYAMVPKKTWFNFLVDSSRRRWNAALSGLTIGWTASVCGLPVGRRYSWSHNNDNNNCCCNDDQRGSPVIAENSMASCCLFLRRLWTGCFKSWCPVLDKGFSFLTFAVSEIGIMIGKTCDRSGSAV